MIHIVPTPMAIVVPVVVEPPIDVWPENTNILFPVGSSKVMLTLQRPLLCGVIQDAIDNMRASLLFDNALPDATLSLQFARDSLTTAAQGCCPEAAVICHRLQEDVEYFNQLVPLVHPPMVCDAETSVLNY